MADQSSSGSAGKAKTWLKAVVGTVAGLLSGAVLMYLTPLIDRVIKPAKPVANFGYQPEGLAVTFHNQSMGGNSGWWDFGDGSPLQPITPEQQVLTHTYARAGDYTVKLALRNLIGEEHDRTVIVKVEAPRTDPPSIAGFEIFPVSLGSYAPATFRIASKINNAQLFVWDLGDDRPLEISTEHGEKMVTFDRPGAYVVKLAAVNGTQATVKSDIVQVNVPPVGAVTAILSVTDEATRVESVNTSYTFTDAYPNSSRENVYKVNRQVPAQTGFEITDVQFQTVGKQVVRMQGKSDLAIEASLLGIKNARNLRLQIAPDRRSVRLTGGLIKDGAGKGASPTISVPVILTQERRTTASRAAIPVTATLTIPGSATLTMPSLPADWVDPRRQARVELREGEKVVWQESQLARTALVTLQNKRCIVNTTPAGSQVRVDLVEVPTGLIPSPN